MRLLVIEDDPDLNRQLATALTDAGYVVDRAFDGEEGHYLGETEPYDAVILDIGLPKMDGLSVLESWRRAGRAMPVLMLTARDRWSDKVQGFDAGAGFAANGYADHSPGGYTLAAVLVAEVVLTAFFLYIILGATDERAPVGFAPIAIGLGLTLIHLISIPISNTSVNPARSTAVAFFQDGAAGQRPSGVRRPMRAFTIA
mgnify:CR=1 FL=1